MDGFFLYAYNWIMLTNCVFSGILHLFLSLWEFVSVETWGLGRHPAILFLNQTRALRATTVANRLFILSLVIIHTKQSHAIVFILQIFIYTLFLPAK